MAAPKFDLKNFVPLKAKDVGVPRSILLFGPPKRGKTTCAASIMDVPGYERTLVIDVEGGASAISEWYPEADILPVTTAEDFDAVIIALVDGKLLEPTSGEPYQCVIIDTLDKAQERKLEWFDKQPDAFSNGKKDHRYKWGAIKAWTTRMADALHMAPFLTIFVAHVMDHEDDKTKKVTQTVALGGSSKQTFPATPDLVGYFDIDRVKDEATKQFKSVRTLDFSVTDKRVTGQRYADKLDGKVGDPTMEKLYRKIAPQLFEK